MKNLLIIGSFLLISITASAQVQTFTGDTTGTTRAGIINVGANSSGRVGQKTNSGNFQPFALLAEVVAATSGGVTNVNGKTGPTVTLTTNDIAENVNQYYTNARARSALSATGFIIYNNTTGAFTTNAISGDGTMPANGTTFTLNTVNSNTGTYGSGVNVPVLTLDGKGRVVAAATAPITLTGLGAAAAATSLYYDRVATYSALGSYTVPAGQVYLIKVANDASQSAPYNTNQFYIKDDSGATFKLALIKQ